jgi:hypothetical protein
MGQGLASSTIAAELGLCPSTVSTHLKKTYKKFGVHNRTHAAVKVLRAGFGLSQPGPRPVQTTQQRTSSHVPSPASHGAVLGAHPLRTGRGDLPAAASAIGTNAPSPSAPINHCPHCGSELRTPLALSPKESTQVTTFPARC